MSEFCHQTSIPDSQFLGKIIRATQLGLIVIASRISVEPEKKNKNVIFLYNNNKKYVKGKT